MDYNATAPLLPSAKDAMIQAMDESGNPSSVHREGQMARRMINRAREHVANLCDADPAHVTFISGATEAACHLLTPNYKMGRSAINISKLYISAVEHPCVLAGGRFNASDVVIVAADGNGRLDLDDLEQKLGAHDDEQGLPMLALQGANNETGVLHPVEKALEIAKSHKAITVLDAVQAAGKIEFSMRTLGADFAFISAHKIGGPKGVGAIISQGEILMPEPLVSGGGHEKGHRGGTENLIGIIGFGASCLFAKENLSKFLQLSKIRDETEERISNIAPDIMIYGKGIQRIANTICFSLPDTKSETLQIAFDIDGVATSSGSACSSGKVGESHVLAAMGADTSAGALRVSIGHGTTEDDIAAFLSAFEKINTRRLQRRAEAAA